MLQNTKLEILKEKSSFFIKIKNICFLFGIIEINQPLKI